MNIVELFALIMIGILVCAGIAKVVDLGVKWAFVFHVAKKLKQVSRERGRKNRPPTNLPKTSV